MMLQLSENEIFKFFQEHTLKARWHELFNNTDIVRGKIFDFLNNPILKGCKGIGDYSYGFIYHRFKYYYFVFLLNEAMNIAITTAKSTDLLANVLDLLNEDHLKSAVEGEMMVNAVIDVLQSIHAETASESALIGSKIYRLKREVLDNNNKDVE